MIINASAHQIPLADKSVHAIITSPPYFGLRKYEGAQEVDWPEGVYAPMTGCLPCIEVPAMQARLGNEPTIEAFIWHLLLVFRECRRVLRDDGVCWVNLGDSYISAKSRYKNTAQTIHNQDRRGERQMRGLPQDSNDFRLQGWTDGQLAAIPHRFALAAQADGWTLRNDCVWHKKSAMPESVTGWRIQDGQMRRGSWRHTRAHEYVFQLVKGMGYWSDSEIVKEAAKDWGTRDRTNGKYHNEGTGIQPHSGLQGGETSRNPRSVFSPSPSPYNGAHFATFPKELIRPLILSSVPRKACPECGQGWAAVVSSLKFDRSSDRRVDGVKCAQGKVPGGNTRGMPVPKTQTFGYQSTCDCGCADSIAGIVLDPFVGSGTTLEVARECGVRAIGLDISHTYLNEQASWRGMQVAKPDFLAMPLFSGLAQVA